MPMNSKDKRIRSIHIVWVRSRRASSKGRPGVAWVARQVPWVLLALWTAEEALGAPPSIRIPSQHPTLDAFLTKKKPKRHPSARTDPGRFFDTGVRPFNGDLRAVLFYGEVGGQIYGLPALLSLEEFAAYQHVTDRKRLLDEGLAEEPRMAPGEEGGLLNIKIPVKVPKGLSAITGEGETDIRITGSRRIDLDGISNYTVGQAQTRGRNSKFPSIDFEQDSQLNVQGTIGERITIALQQDSHSRVELGESLSLRYDGDEDDIIQEIEAGSTSLRLPGARLVGFSAQGRGGLFGIKARGQLGGLNLTVVTSQDKAASNRRTFQGKAEEFATEVRDYQYLEDTYFFLDERYRDRFPNDPSEADLVDTHSIRVFINDFNDINDLDDRAGPGIAYAFWNDASQPTDAQGDPIIGGGSGTTTDLNLSGGRIVEEGFFHELSTEKFLVDARGYLIMRSGRVNRGFVLAVAYRTVDGREFGDIGFIPDAANPDEKIELKLIKSRQQRPDDPSWELSWRNVYGLAGRNIEPEGFQVQIVRDVPGREQVDNQGGTPYLQIFGLDTHTNGSSASSPPDNLIDIDGGNNLPGLNLALGHLVFSQLEPFGSVSGGAGGLDDDARVPEIYTTTNNQTRSLKSRFILRIRSKSRATQYTLGPGVVEGSEEVILNNRRLARGRDYQIQYEIGTLKFIGDATDLVSDPAANLRINYASKSLFGLGSQKSLVGVRAEHPLGGNQSLLGMTLLYSKQGSPSHRVRVGEEPARTLIWDTNASLHFQPEFMTDLVNKLPFVATEAPSRLNIEAEIAQSLPNPNTKNVAYIDDFEGAQNRLGFGVSKLGWSRASTPTREGSGLSLPQARLTWYNPVRDDRINLFQIQPNREDIPLDQSLVDILVLRFEPRRTSGFPVTTRDPNAGSAEASWGGIMRYLGGFDLSNSKSIEVWVRGNAGVMHIDLGEVAERVSLPLDHTEHNPPPSGFRTEDEELPGLGTGDQLASPEEDIGLDRLTDAQEASVFKLIYGQDAVPPSDPSGDNFSDVDLDESNYSNRYPPGVNGSEGNNSERNALPDTEDLNRNGTMDVTNRYLRYSVDLATDQGFNPTTGLYDGPILRVEGTQSDSTSSPWRLLRLPLRGDDAPRSAEGAADPTFADAVDFVRLWVEHDEPTAMQLYAFDVVGSNWLEDPVPVTSGEFSVASIGTDNTVYEAPPDIELEKDPQTGLEQLERSLALQFEDLAPGDRVSASRAMLQGQNYTRYRLMRMDVHGGNPSSPTHIRNFPAVEDSASTGGSPVELFIRFAPIAEDTLNIYEYRSPIYRGWAPEANAATIDLELLSQLKGRLSDLKLSGAASDSLTLSLSSGEYFARFNADDNSIGTRDEKGKFYFVRGNPSLSSIRSFTIGVRNRGTRTLDGKNEVWVNELRIDEIRKKRALSAVFNLQATLADLGNLSVELERRSGDFQDLRGRASGNTTSRFRVNGQVNLNKFLPSAWNATIPVRFNYNRSASVPRIRPGSDVVLTSEQQRDESNVQSNSLLNITLRKRPAPRNPSLFALLFFDRINASMSLSRNNSEGGAITRRRIRKTENLNGNFSYELRPTQKGARIFKWLPLFKRVRQTEVFYFPENVRYTARVSRNLNDQRAFTAVVGDTSDLTETRRETFSMNEVYRVTMKPLRSLTASYNLELNRDLRNGFGLTRLQFGRETNRSQQFSFGYTTRLLSWVNFSSQYSASYRERLETGGQTVPGGSRRRGLTVNGSKNINARTSFNLPLLFRRLKGKRTEGFSLRRVVGSVGSSFQALTTSVGQTSTFNLFGLKQRPRLPFQFGFSDTTTVDRFGSSGVTRVDRRALKDNAMFSTGLRFPVGLSVQTSGSYTRNRNFGNVNTEQETRTLPRLTANWRGLERLPLLRAVLASSSLQLNVAKTHTQIGEGGLDTLSVTSDSRNTIYRPLYQWTARLKNKMTLNFRGDQSERTDLRYQRNVGDEAPPLQTRLLGKTITDQSDFKSTLTYYWKPGFLESLKGNINVDLDYTRGSSRVTEIPRTTSEDEPAEPVMRKDQSTWSAHLAAQYKFSNTFTGGTRFHHRNIEDRLRVSTNKEWGFKLWGEIRFN